MIYTKKDILKKIKMLVKLMEIFKDGNTYLDHGSIKPKYSLRETYVNPNHVVCMREESNKTLCELKESLAELDPGQEFTRVHINRGQSGLDITVVGSLSVVREKLIRGEKKVLKG
jgi:hypothetical protein